MIPRKIICARCGGETIARAAGTKYCPVCAYYTRLEQARASRAARKARAEAARAAEKPEPEALRGAFRATTRKARGTPKKEAAEKPKTKKIFCARCGVELEVGRGSRQMYCPDCAKAARRESHRASSLATKARGKEAGRLMKEICHNCGKEFLYFYAGNYKALCPDCRGTSSGKVGRPKKEKEKKPRKSQIDAKARAARELGLSYGQYSTMLETKKIKKGA